MGHYRGKRKYRPQRGKHCREIRVIYGFPKWGQQVDGMSPGRLVIWAQPVEV